MPSPTSDGADAAGAVGEREQMVEKLYEYGGLAMRKNYLQKLGVLGSSAGVSAWNNNNNNRNITTAGQSREAPGNQQATYIRDTNQQQQQEEEEEEHHHHHHHHQRSSSSSSSRGGVLLNKIDGSGSITNPTEFTLDFGSTPQRSADDFRMQVVVVVLIIIYTSPSSLLVADCCQYLKKLSYTGVWVPQAQKPPQHQTVIIFDWDDTLLCTSYLNLRAGGQQQSNNNNNSSSRQQDVSRTIQKHLHSIAATDAKLLEMAMAHGETFIITNAMKGWVEYSARKYVPQLLPTLRKVRIISARTEHERQFPGDYHQWKISAFLSVRQALNSQVITNLVSLGDSNIEMDAIHVMGSEFSQALIKTIKFRENPSPDELAKQLELVYQKFDKILVNARNLKISLERKWVVPPTAAPAGAARSRSPSPTTTTTSNTTTTKGSLPSPTGPG
ncbi:hypothetical protein FOZ60_010259 [Perkinsus olseni]|uniref:Uncharacterized protein n=1 Tax=Perkinsus olseni TaxID=32597 RepID=A0A7J6NGS0_PEROL|nr:hypothetical protein FOZ60_010259 [Perkinsus olseni]